MNDKRSDKTMLREPGFLIAEFLACSVIIFVGLVIWNAYG
jgi:hypothetical protein